MTDRRDIEHEPLTDDRSERELELNAEVIKDLDVASDQADDIKGGRCQSPAAINIPTQNA